MRQRQGRDAVGDDEPAGDAPSGPVRDEHGLCAGRHRGADLREMRLRGSISYQNRSRDRDASKAALSRNSLQNASRSASRRGFAKS